MWYSRAEKRGHWLRHVDLGVLYAHSPRLLIRRVAHSENRHESPPAQLEFRLPVLNITLDKSLSLCFFTCNGHCPFSPTLHLAHHHPSQSPLSSQNEPSKMPITPHVDPPIACCMAGSPPLQPHLSPSCPSFMESSSRPPSFSSSNHPAPSASQTLHRLFSLP